MPNLKLLLIEDAIADQVLFVNQFQNEAGLDVCCDCASTISQAFAYLEAARANPYDQIWLDPGLPDLKPSAIGQVLSTLKKHVAAGELRLLTSSASPEVARQAQQQNVALLHKDALNDDSNSEILAVLKGLVLKRSSGATQKVELGKHELRLLYVEGAIGKVEGSLKELNERLRQFDETALQVRMMADLINQLPSLKESIGKLEKLVDKDAQAASSRLEVRKSFLQYAVPAFLTAAATLGTVLVTQYFSATKPPTPTISPTASPTAKP